MQLLMDPSQRAAPLWIGGVAHPPTQRIKAMLSVLGAPPADTLESMNISEDAKDLVASLSSAMPTASQLRQILPGHTNSMALDLLERMLAFEGPRWSAKQCLDHPYLSKEGKARGMGPVPNARNSLLEDDGDMAALLSDRLSWGDKKIFVWTLLYDEMKKFHS